MKANRKKCGGKGAACHDVASNALGHGLFGRGRAPHPAQGDRPEKQAEQLGLDCQVGTDHCLVGLLEVKDHSCRAESGCPCEVRDPVRPAALLYPCDRLLGVHRQTVPDIVHDAEARDQQCRGNTNRRPVLGRELIVQ